MENKGKYDSSWFNGTGLSRAPQAPQRMIEESGEVSNKFFIVNCGNQPMVSSYSHERREFDAGRCYLHNDRAAI